MDLRTRKKIRLSGYDYSASNAYFVTVCVTNKYALLWDLGNEPIQPEHPPLSKVGKIVETAIQQISEHYSNVIVEKYCLMPDHIHLMVFLISDDNEPMTSTPALSSVIGSMKRWATKQIGYSIWQKSFFDEIVLDDVGFHAICKYIDDNPKNYQEDRMITD